MWSFLAIFVVPSFAATLYFALIASDQYIAEARFAVHSNFVDTVTPSSKSSKASTTASFMGGLTASTDDSYMVAAYIRSRACIDEVSRTLNLREIFRRPEADVWARLKADASPEELTKYWDYMVSSYVDPPSGIVTVSVSAFRREDALAIADAIIKASEKVANDVSARAREDVMKSAEKEVTSAEDRVAASLADLRDFREKAGFIDPKFQAESVGRILEDLIGQRIRLHTEYEVSSRAMSPEAPTLQSLKARLDQIDLQIAVEKAKLTSQSKDPKALANLLPKYEELLMRNTFADKLYALAADGLERARLRAEAQTIYVNVFVPPALPQEALFPERVDLLGSHRSGAVHRLGHRRAGGGARRGSQAVRATETVRAEGYAIAGLLKTARPHSRRAHPARRADAIFRHARSASSSPSPGRCRISSSCSSSTPRWAAPRPTATARRCFSPPAWCRSCASTTCRASRCLA